MPNRNYDVNTIENVDQYVYDLLTEDIDSVQNSSIRGEKFELNNKSL